MKRVTTIDLVLVTIQTVFAPSLVFKFNYLKMKLFIYFVDIHLGMNSLRARPSGQKRSRNETSESDSDVSLSDQATACAPARSKSVLLSPVVVPKTFTRSTRLKMDSHENGHGEEENVESSSDERSYYQNASTEERATKMLSNSIVRRKKESFVNKAGPSQPKRVTTSLQKFTNQCLLEPPVGLKVEMVKATTAELEWSLPSNEAHDIKFLFRVRYWREGQHGSLALQWDVESSDTGCLLRNLVPDTTYLTNIFAISEDENQASGYSNTSEFTTLDKDIRAVDSIKNRSKKIGNHHGLDLYAVPLTKTTKSGAKLDRFVFGKPYHSSDRQHKTIVLMGVTGSGKTTIINAMINYVFNIQSDDPFRFQLIQKRPTKTNRIAIYDIYHNEEFKNPFSLTIVDTPSFVDNPEKNKEIAEMICDLFRDRREIIDLNMIGLVAQASIPRLMDPQLQIFDAVSNIFGNKGHTNFLLTCSDSHRPPFLDYLCDIDHPCPTKTVSGDPYAYNKFNSAGFFGKIDEESSTGHYNRSFWNMSVENFERFFHLLRTMKPI